MKAEDFVAINLGTECKGLGIANASSLIKKLSLCGKRARDSHLERAKGSPSQKQMTKATNKL